MRSRRACDPLGPAFLELSPTKGFAKRAYLSTAIGRMDANSSLRPVPLTVPALWHARPLRWAKHEDVLLAGQPSRSIYCNHDGWFARYKLLHDGSRQIVDFG